MKRLVTLLLAAGIALGSAFGTANAVELKAKGSWQFGFIWHDMYHGKDDTFLAAQRLRPQFQFVASENLKAVLVFEIGYGQWGASNGWAIGTDGTNVKTKNAYLDWIVPETDIKVRMGLQPLGLPQFTFMQPVLERSNDMAGITVNVPFNDLVGLSLFWARPYNDYSTPHDSIDLFGLSVPFTGDGWKATPYVMLGSVSEDALAGASANTGYGSDVKRVVAGLAPTGSLLNKNATSYAGMNDDRGLGWWLGFGGELTLFDPFKIAVDFVYGSIDMGEGLAWDGKAMDMKRRGWSVSALAQYKLDFVTPGLIFWYSSGDDGNPYDGSERLPFIYGRSVATNFGFDGGSYNASDTARLSFQGSGMWGIGLRIDDINYIENLKHNLRATYMRGTNSRGMATRGAVPSPFDTLRSSGYDGMYLTRGDQAWEFDFDTKYQIYKNLSAHLEMSYIHLDLKEAAWGKKVADHNDNAWKVGVYMRYLF